MGGNLLINFGWHIKFPHILLLQSSFYRKSSCAWSNASILSFRLSTSCDDLLNYASSSNQSVNFCPRRRYGSDGPLTLPSTQGFESTHQRVDSCTRCFQEQLLSRTSSEKKKHAGKDFHNSTRFFVLLRPWIPNLIYHSRALTAMCELIK